MKGVRLTRNRIGYHSILGLFICIFLIFFTNLYLRPFKSPSSETYFINPTANLEYFTFGYRELVADILWLRAIQDLDQCERKLGPDEECTRSWVYRMTDKVTDLSPKFRIIYATVPLLLAIGIKDTVGAIELLDKGLKYYPNDWPILYRGGYLYLFEKGDRIKAAEYFIRAQKNGAPPWLASFATRLYTEAGRWAMAEQLIKEYESTGLSEALLNRMRNQLEKAVKKSDKSQ